MRLNLAQNWHFWSFWARPCWLIWCPVVGLVGGCGARAVSRKAPIYFMVITFSVQYKMNRSSLSNEIYIDSESRVKARQDCVFYAFLSFTMKGRNSEWWNVRHPFDEMTFRDDVDAWIRDEAVPVSHLSPAPFFNLLLDHLPHFLHLPLLHLSTHTPMHVWCWSLRWVGGVQGRGRTGFLWICWLGCVILIIFFTSITNHKAI